MTSADQAIRQLRAFAIDNHGVFSRTDCHRFGLNQHQISRAIAQGHWKPYRGVFVLSEVPDSDLARLSATLRHSGTRAAVTGPSALRLHDFDVAPRDYAMRRFPHPTNSIFISVPTGFHARFQDVVFLREFRFDPPIVHVEGLAVVSKSRAVIDSIRLLGWVRTKDAVYRALQTKWITPETLLRATEEFKNRRGNTELRRAAVAASSGSHAESELLAQRLLRRAGLNKFTSNLPVSDERGLIGNIDIAFVKQQVAIEIDGQAWHTDHSRFQHDRQRQNRLINIGWLVLRFTWDDLTDRPAYVTRTVREALAATRTAGL